MRKTITILAAAGFLAATMSVAYAGSMAITMFDSLPSDLEAGETYDLEYTILQHGVKPVDGIDTALIVSRAGGDNLVFEGEPTGEPGTYAVEVTILEPGEWSWKVTQGPFAAHELGIIDVGSAPGSGSASGMGSALEVVLPLAAIAAGLFTLREWRKSAFGVPTPEVG